MRRFRLMGVAAATLTVVSFTVLPSVASSGSGAGSAGDHVPVCLSVAVVGIANCDAIQLLNPAQNWHGSHISVSNGGNGKGKKPGGGGGGGGTISGFYPTDLQSAYGLTSLPLTAGSNKTVAIVDAYNDPYAAIDLSTYRNKMYPSPTSFSFGGLTIVNESGQSSPLPRNNASWSEEISLDLDMVSAICPECRILLVEANSASLNDLATAAAYAASHANAVSNSYGAAEFPGEATYDSSYMASVPITVSAGDSGYGVQYPAASPDVTAVGGTTLTKSTSGTSETWSQTVWSGTGSGCSAYEPIPSWQPKTSLCSNRTVADTAAVADPNTGVAVYDSFREPGWMVFGGTSVASPIIASIYALAASTTSTARSLYGATLNLVKIGSNGSCGNYLCNASKSIQYPYPAGGSGYYNGPTGMGTPIGTNGF